MHTSYDILETLAEQTDMIVATLQDDEKHQFINLLSAVTRAENEKLREDAVDKLDDFCRNFQAIREVLDNIYNLYYGENRGKHKFELNEEEQKIRQFANRLIKTTEASIEKDSKTKEKKKP